MSRETVERLTAAMNANKIKYNKEFATALQRGFPDEARAALFEEITGDMDTLIRRGVNSDFSKDMKKTLEHLSDIAVKLGEENRRSLTYERLRVEKRECLANMKPGREHRPTFNMCDNVRDYLESAKEGMRIMQAAGDAQTGVEVTNMKTCRKIIDEIIASLDGVIDITSMNAAEHYNNVVAGIRSWRIKLARSNGLYDATSVEMLRGIQRTVRQWSGLCSPSLRHAKPQDCYEIPVDDLEQTIQSVSIRQNVEMFLNRCEIYAQETANMRDNGSTEKLRECRARLGDIERRKQDIVARFKSGALSREDAEFDLQDLKDQEDYIKYDMERLKADVVSREEVTRRRELIRKIERPIRRLYNMVKNNRLHVYAMFADVDCSKLVSIINNNASSNEVAEGIAQLQETMVKSGIMNTNGDLNIRKIEERLAEVDRMNDELREANLPTEEVKEEGSLLDALLSLDSETEEKQETEHTLLSDIL